MDLALYSIGVVSRMVGVPVSTLRTWEDRYGLVIAVRSTGGQRRYTRAQLAQLSFIGEQIEQGFSPGDAHRLLAEQIDQGGDLVAASGREEPGVLILIAERDRVAASLEDYLLRTEGFRVATAASAEEAQRMFDELGPAIVIVELLLSGGVGGQLIEHLKHEGATVIAISPLDAREVAAEFGAAAFVQKPIDPLVLVSTVRDLLGTSALSRGRSTRR
ncbi:MAG: MerR family transcriptional regulator [Solirubrobacteraceae bacterium]